MPIQVTCPNCLKRFQVSDKFAGKSGPCPNCKKQIRVPETSEEVVIHVPDDGAPKDRRGQSVLKPIKREETDVTRSGLLITVGAILAAIGLAIGIRVTAAEPGEVPLVARVMAVILLAPPLVWAGYSFVRDQELEPYVGQELRIRVLILSAIFAALWLVYWLVPTYVLEIKHPSEMSYLAAGITLSAMLIIGAFASVATFELEFLSGLTHVGLYLLSTIALALISGLPLAAAGG